MRKITLSILALCFFLVAAVRYTGGAVIPVILPALARYMPGEVLPQNMRCDWQHYWETALFCETVVSGVQIYVSYDAQKLGISRLSYMTLGSFNIGELILTWGKPIGIYQTRYAGITLYWTEGRSAYVSTRDFCPFSEVGFLSFSNIDSDSFKAWRGFTKRLA